MTGRPEQGGYGSGGGAEQLVRDAALAGRRMAARVGARLADFSRDPAARLDDRLRVLLDHHLSGIIAAVEAGLRDEAVRLLLTREERDVAERLRRQGAVAMTRLAATGQLAEPALAAELLARLKHDLIAERLPVRAGAEDEPSLLVRLTDVADAEVAAGARALLAAESRRREALSLIGIDGSDLPAELHQRLVWRVAAAMRGPGGAALDRALTDAVQRLLGTYDEGERAEARAMRLALAIDARPSELPPLLDEAIGDGRLSLVVAVLAHAAGLSFEQVRALMVEPDDERWWLLLRAIDLDPLTVARLALALAQADPRRADEDLPTMLDAVNAVGPADARAALASLRLPDDFRAALDVLAGEAVV